MQVFTGSYNQILLLADSSTDEHRPAAQRFTEKFENAFDCKMHKGTQSRNIVDFTKAALTDHHATVRNLTF